MKFRSVWATGSQATSSNTPLCSEISSSLAHHRENASWGQAWRSEGAAAPPRKEAASSPGASAAPLVPGGVRGLQNLHLASLHGAAVPQPCPGTAATRGHGATSMPLVPRGSFQSPKLPALSSFRLLQPRAVRIPPKSSLLKSSRLLD